MKKKEVNKLTKDQEIKSIDKLNIDEIKSKINSLKKDLFNFRFRKVNGQLEDTSKVSQLKNKSHLLKKDLFNLRFMKANGQLNDTAKVSEIKKGVARILTQLNKKKI